MNDTDTQPAPCRMPWNKGKLIGQKPPLKLQEIWTLGTRLQLTGETRQLALFNLAIDGMLRACDLVRLQVQDVAHGGHVLARASVIQQETGEPVRFELTEQTREAVRAWMAQARLARGSYLFPSRQHDSPRLSTRQYGRIVKRDRTLRG
jgi:integrase